ncbi:hypothetical protein HZU73_02508 [Apis mellifera caucasica]|uniref:Odorant receptor n=1 Tax=Apis mellifera TaxID=7460 RepID=A0A7M7L315_APIME|nr:uncharacterized protein LOC102656221 [Apis mellifera]KAG6802037.1 hypothetical protein HZU73_02508 [Apis mellifera caucasica]|eukprot:XP_026296276.1 uncharacterized protein LOC102656221 [Apis mellifera]
MNVFDNQYRTYRIILKIIGLWPYDNSIYVWIYRLCLLIYFLVVVLVQIFSLAKSEISLRNCIVTLSTTFPTLLYCLRYIYCLTLFSYTELLFDNIRTEEHILQDMTEIQIQTKYLDISSHIIDIFCWLSFICVAATWIFILNPVTLDVIMPLNKSRIHFSLIFLSNDRRTYIDIFMVLNLIIILIFGLLSLICSESLTNIFSYYVCRQFDIVSYRMRKIIVNLSMPNLPKTDLKLRDIHRVVDIHCRTIENIHIASTNTATQYLLAIILCILSFSVNLYRLYNALIIMNNRMEIFGSALMVMYHLMIAFYNNHCGQLIIDSNFGIFKELYASTWYRIPLKAQKLLLFMMFKSSVGCELRLCGLFTASYAGFTSMMSSSFSYCAVIYSIQ